MRKHYHDFDNYLGAHPYFTNIGVYDRVFLEIVDTAAIRHVDVMQELSAGHESAVVRLGIEAESTSGDPLLHVALFGPGGERVAVAETNHIGSKAVYNTAGPSIEPHHINAGEDAFRKYDLEIAVEHPDLWWPRGHGGQPLYELKVRILVEGEVCDTVTRHIGFRDAEIDENLDCRINGRSIKLWKPIWKNISTSLLMKRIVLEINKRKLMLN